ncbi:MAG TPA: type II secretion system protein [Candidatus Paceibacterota bacterium]
MYFLKAKTFSLKAISGFTLIELLVVIAIISLLSSIVLASFTQARARARDAVRLSDLHQIRLALELFFDDKGHYPGCDEGINSGWRKIRYDSAGNGTDIVLLLQPYMGGGRVPEDPRDDIDDTNYYYAYDAEHFVGQYPSCPVICSSTDCATTLSINKSESGQVYHRDTTCGIEGNIGMDDPGDNSSVYNITLYPKAKPMSSCP